MTPYRPLLFSKVIVYMLQNVEYNVTAYLRWLARSKNYKRIMYRRQLVRTKATRLFRIAALTMHVGMYVLALLLLYLAFMEPNKVVFVAASLSVVALSPLVVSLGLIVPLVIARILIQKPREKKLIRESKRLFASSSALRVAIAGSYGKTSMKELLANILATQKKTAATPANKNVAVSHAVFAKKLKGDEDVIILEYGEGSPGDVARFSDTFQPNIVIITGIAPAHLDQYPSMEAAAHDIFSASSVDSVRQTFVNGESEYAKPYITPDHCVYTQKGIPPDVTVSDVTVSIEGTSFSLVTKKATYDVKSNLLGRHTVGPIVCAIAIAEMVGVSKSAIEDAIATFRPYEHRMQPRKENGVHIIDDTYNGNIEGMAAGLALLSELPANRKIYVTPGLVDQGAETESVHRKLGALIAKAHPDIVVLMQHSVTRFITESLSEHGYQGEVHLEEDPLAFYTNLHDFTASGDLVLMQNDWPDNYA